MRIGMRRTAAPVLPLGLPLLAAALLWACSCEGDRNPSALDAEIDVQSGVPDPQAPAGQSRWLLDFGGVHVGKEADRTLTIRNKGATEMVVGAMSLDAPFRSDLSADVTVPIDGELRVSFTFQPVQEGPAEFVVTLRSTGGDLAVRLVGHGVIPRFACEPLDLAFGSVVRTTFRTLSLSCTNESELDGVLTVGDLQGDDADLFSYSLARDERDQVLIQAGATLEIGVTFRANREGEVSAFFTLAEEDGSRVGIVHLSGTTIRSALQLDPDVTCPGIDFGFVAPDTTVEKTLTLRNLGIDELVISDLHLEPTSDPEFSLRTAAPFRIPADDPATAEPEHQVPVLLAFSPTALGRRQATLELRSSDPNSPTVRVCLAGFGGGPTIACSPAAIDFGQVAVGVPVVRSYVCANAGSDDPSTSEDNLRVEDPSSSSGEFAAVIRDRGTTDPDGDGFSVGQTFTVDVTYAPADEGVDSESITLLTNDTASPEVVTPVSGNGRDLPPCVYRIVPPQLRFGIVDRGHSATLEFGIQNLLDTECLVTDLKLSDETDPAFTLPDGALSDASISGQGELRVPVTFAPPDYDPAFDGQVQFYISDPANPFREVPLRGTSSEPCALIAPDDLDFGVVAPGCSTRERDLQIINVCDRPIHVTAIDINAEGGASDEFFVTSRPTLPATVPPGQSQEFKMAYRPADDGVDLGSVFIQTQETPEPYMATMRGEGRPDALQTDNFAQDDRPQVDLLWVIDNSGSMYEEQTAVASNLTAFLNFAIAQQIDFQIGVTTTGLDDSGGCPGGVGGGEDGRLFPVDNSHPRILTPATADIADHYAYNINVGTCHYDEQGLEAAYRALTPPVIDNADDPRHTEPSDGNLGFMRRDAHLSIIFVSDEEDQSPQTTNFYYNFFLSLKGFRNSNLFSAHAIVGDPGTGCSSADSGDRYVDVATRSGGIFQSICTQDWEAALEQVGTAAFGFKTRFFLTNTPADGDGGGIGDGDIDVQLDGRSYPSTGPRGEKRWEYNGETNSIDFYPLAVPEPGSQIEVTYHVACL